MHIYISYIWLLLLLPRVMVSVSCTFPSFSSLHFVTHYISIIFFQNVQNINRNKTLTEIASITLRHLKLNIYFILRSLTLYAWSFYIKNGISPKECALHCNNVELFTDLIHNNWESPYNKSIECYLIVYSLQYQFVWIAPRPSDFNIIYWFDDPTFLSAGIILQCCFVM